MFPSLRSNTKLTTLPTLYITGKLDGADWLLVSLRLTAPNPIDTEIFNKVYFARLYDGLNRSRD